MSTDKAKSRIKRLVIGLGVFQIMMALSAVAGGVGLLGDPSGGNLGFSPEQLSGTPFSGYLVPGLFLLVVIGVGHLLGGIVTLARYRYAGEIAMLLGALLIIWIIIQVLLIGLVSLLQPAYFLFGVVEILLGRRLPRVHAGIAGFLRAPKIGFSCAATSLPSLGQPCLCLPAGSVTSAFLQFTLPSAFPRAALQLISILPGLHVSYMPHTK